jgi:hypothetical protein
LSERVAFHAFASRNARCHAFGSSARAIAIRRRRRASNRASPPSRCATNNRVAYGGGLSRFWRPARGCAASRIASSCHGRRCQAEAGKSSTACPASSVFSPPTHRPSTGKYPAWRRVSSNPSWCCLDSMRRSRSRPFGGSAPITKTAERKTELRTCAA